MLIAILLPVLGKARQQAYAVQCEANLRSIGQAIAIYVTTSKGGVLPYGSWDGLLNTSVHPYSYTPPAAGVQANNASDWTILLMAAVTPHAGANWAGQASSQALQQNNRKMFSCPEAPIEKESTIQAVSDYACHPRLMPELDYTENFIDPVTNGNRQPYRISHIKRSSEVAIIFDAAVQQLPAANGGGWSVNGSGIFLPIASNLDASRFYYDTYLTDDYALVPNESYMTPSAAIDLTPTAPGATPADINKDSPGNAGNIRFRHNGNKICNALMVDGHVEAFGTGGVTRGSLLRGNINVNP